MDPAAFRRDLHPGRVASASPLTLHDIAPFRRNKAPVQESVIRTLLEKPSTLEELIEAVYGYAVENQNPVSSIRHAIHVLRGRLLPGWHIDTETRYVLRRR